MGIKLVKEHSSVKDPNLKQEIMEMAKSLNFLIKQVNDSTFWNRIGTVLSPKTTGDDVSLEFGDLVSEQNPDAIDAIRIKGTKSDVDVVLENGGYFNIWDIDDNDIFYVDDDGNMVISGYLDMNSNQINELTDPTLDQDAATKKYVDDEKTLVDARIKAWIHFNGTGVIAIDDSFNVSSIIDDGTGDYTITWDTDFANADYAAVGMAMQCFAIFSDVVATTNIQIRTTNSSNGAADYDNVCLIAIGDQV